MKHPFIYFLVVLFFGQIVFGQNFIVKEFNTNNGLISASNKQTIQSSDNFYYTCSFGGLLRFDGTSFKAYTNSDGLHNYRVNDIYEQQPGSFLICNYYDILRFDGSKFSDFKTNLPSNTQYEKIIKLSTGNEIFITNLGAFQLFKKQTLSPYYFENKIIANDFLEYSTGLYIYFNQVGNFVSYQSKLRPNWRHVTLPYGLEFNGFLAYQNSVLINTNKGLYRFNEGALELFKIPGFLGKIPLKYAYNDKKGNNWLSDADDNLWLISGKKQMNLSQQYNLSQQPPQNIFEDINNNIVVTQEQSIKVFKERFFEEIELENRVPNGYFLGKYNADTVFVAVCKQGLVLIANGKRIIKPIDTSVLNFTDTYKNGRYFRSAHFPEGILHIFRAGFYKIENRKLKLFNPKKIEATNLLRGYYDIENEHFMAGSDGKLFIIGERKIDTLSFEKYAKGLGPHSFVKTQNGAILFVASHKKLLKYESGNLTDITDYLKINGKDFDIYWYENRLWVIVLGIEIRKYSYENGKFNLLQTISKDNGLIDANIGRFSKDEMGNLWLNCFSGLYFLHLDAQQKVYSKKIPLLQSKESTHLIENIFYNNDHMYAAATNMIFDISTQSKWLNISPIACYFSSVKVNNKNILLENNFLKSDKIFAFPADSNNISFTANTIYFGYEDAIQYQYKLEDLDAEWHNLAQGNTINYNNLTNGHYIFRLRSVNNFNESHFTEAKFEFEIKPPYYKSWWFRVLLGLLAISSIYIFIRQRDLQKYRKNQLDLQVTNLKLTALQSQMNPHFIFNSLNSIQNYIVQQKPLEAARYLSKFSKLMRRILDQSFSNLQPLSEIVETLKMYMELEAFRFSNEFSYEIKMDDEAQIADVKLPPLILQPYVENAIIHGLMPKEGDKKLLIHLYLQQNILHCVVDDNGLGKGNKLEDKAGHISRGQKLTADMLATMKTLINADAKIEITDKKDSENKPTGTKIDLIIPINHF